MIWRCWCCWSIFEIKKYFGWLKEEDKEEGRVEERERKRERAPYSAVFHSSRVMSDLFGLASAWVYISCRVGVNLLHRRWRTNCVQTGAGVPIDLVPRARSPVSMPGLVRAPATYYSFYRRRWSLSAERRLLNQDEMETERLRQVLQSLLWTGMLMIIMMIVVVMGGVLWGNWFSVSAVKNILGCTYMYDIYIHTF